MTHDAGQFNGTSHTVTDTHRHIIPRLKATRTLGFHLSHSVGSLDACYTVFGFWHSREIFTHGPMMHDCSTQTLTHNRSQNRNLLTEGMTSTQQSWWLSSDRSGSSWGKVLFLWLGNWGFPHILFCCFGTLNMCRARLLSHNLRIFSGSKNHVTSCYGEQHFRNFLSPCLFSFENVGKNCLQISTPNWRSAETEI